MAGYFDMYLSNGVANGKLSELEARAKSGN
jgi:hypothetical protein